MYWGYLGFFHKDISLLSGQKMVYMRDLTWHFYLYQICVYVIYIFEIGGLQAFQF